MQLRDHPLISRFGRHSWPPVWTWIGGRQDEYLTGEIGILREVRLRDASKCFLVIDHNDRLYMGCLMFDDPVFARQMTRLFEANCGYSIVEIGSLDVSYLN